MYFLILKSRPIYDNHIVIFAGPIVAPFFMIKPIIGTLYKKRGESQSIPFSGRVGYNYPTPLTYSEIIQCEKYTVSEYNQGARDMPEMTKTLKKAITWLLMAAIVASAAPIQGAAEGVPPEREAAKMPAGSAPPATIADPSAAISVFDLEPPATNERLEFGRIVPEDSFQAYAPGLGDAALAPDSGASQSMAGSPTGEFGCMVEPVFSAPINPTKNSAVAGGGNGNSRGAGHLGTDAQQSTMSTMGGATISETLYSYDVFGRLIDAQGGGIDEQYEYRCDWLRHSKTSNGVKTIHIWGGANIVLELIANKTVKASYTRGMGLIKNGQGQWFHFNAHGDVVGLTDSSGNPIRAYEYDAFGVEASPDPNDTNPWRYCGEYLDLETNTYYLRARYYQPATGRFLSEDPIRDGFNWYTYCGDNPIKFVDPWGLLKIDNFSSSISIMLNDAIGKSDGFVGMLTTSFTILINSPFVGGVSEDLLKLGESIDFWTVKKAVFNDIPILPYDEFLTECGTIYAWACVYHLLSMPTDVFQNGSEWGAWIYRNPITSQYCFGAEPLPADRGESWVRLSPKNPAYIIAGWIHSHPNPGIGWLVNQFSGIPGDGGFTVSNRVPGYLVTPSGVVMRLDPSWPRTNVSAIPNSDPHVSVYIENIFRI